MLGNWLFSRALRLPHATVVGVAKFFKVDPAKIDAYNDAFAGIVAVKAQDAVDKIK